MVASRMLVDALSEWQACDDMDRTLIKRDRGGRGRHREADQRRSALAEAIEGEIIPRLMLTHKLEGQSAERRVVRTAAISVEDVAEFSRLVLDHDVAVAHSFLSTFRDRGVEVDTIFVELLAPTARLLGEMWRADICDFTDVTVGLSRLQQLLHQFSPGLGQTSVADVEARRLLLLPVPGEQHTLGIMLVEEFFRRAGWECCSSMPTSLDPIMKMVRREHFDVIGFSASSDKFLEPLHNAIAEVRKISKNKNVLVLVGGAVFLEKPELVTKVGADATGDGGNEAVLRLRSLFDTRQSN